MNQPRTQGSIKNLYMPIAVFATKLAGNHHKTLLLSKFDRYTCIRRHRLLFNYDSLLTRGSYVLFQWWQRLMPRKIILGKFA